MYWVLLPIWIDFSTPANFDGQNGSQQNTCSCSEARLLCCLNPSDDYKKQTVAMSKKNALSNIRIWWQSK